MNLETSKHKIEKTELQQRGQEIMELYDLLRDIYKNEQQNKGLIEKGHEYQLPILVETLDKKHKSTLEKVGARLESSNSSDIFLSLDNGHKLAEFIDNVSKALEEEKRRHLYFSNEILDKKMIRFSIKSLIDSYLNNFFISSQASKDFLGSDKFLDFIYCIEKINTYFKDLDKNLGHDYVCGHDEIEEFRSSFDVLKIIEIFKKNNFHGFYESMDELKELKENKILKNLRLVKTVHDIIYVLGEENFNKKPEIIDNYFEKLIDTFEQTAKKNNLSWATDIMSEYISRLLKLTYSHIENNLERQSMYKEMLVSMETHYKHILNDFKSRKKDIKEEKITSEIKKFLDTQLLINF